MGLFKKNDAADDDGNRSALFGHRSKAKSPAATNPYAQPQSSNTYAQPQSSNPYAQPQPNNPYSQPQPNNPYAQTPINPYAQAPPDPYLAQKEKAYSTPPNPYPSTGKPSPGASASDRKSPAFTGTMAGGGYGNAKFGNQAGYGDNRYGNQNQSARQGGYGGFLEDENRNALFGTAQERVQRQQQAPPPYGDGGNSEMGGGYNGAAAYNPGPKYEDRQLTAEEEEEEEVNATKQQIKFIKQGDVSSTRNALRIAAQAEEVALDSLARLGQQGELISSTEKSLDVSHNQNKIAEEKAKELKTLNRSMWAVHVANPFTANSREARRDREILERHEEERIQREATRRAGYQANERMKKNFQDLSSKNPEKRDRNLAERARYQFEADSDDENMENEIDDNIDQLSAITGRLNMLARATGEEVDHQNKALQRVSEKGDKVDLGIAANKARLDRIR